MKCANNSSQNFFYLFVKFCPKENHVTKAHSNHKVKHEEVSRNYSKKGQNTRGKKSKSIFRAGEGEPNIFFSSKNTLFFKKNYLF